MLRWFHFSKPLVVLFSFGYLFYTLIGWATHTQKPQFAIKPEYITSLEGTLVEDSLLAGEDLQDATYFLIERWEQFAIDPHKIILAGSSAGAETVLNTAFQPPYCYGLDSGPVSYAGVISMAGAIPDTTLIYDDSAVPALLFHGTEDMSVPYATAPSGYCEEGQLGYLILNGSYTIAERLRELGKPYWLYTICGAGHEVHSLPMTAYFDDIMQFCCEFSYNFV